MWTRRLSVVVALVPMALLALGACGGGDDPGAGSGDSNSMAASLVPVTSTAGPPATESTMAATATTKSSANTAKPASTQSPATTVRPTTVPSPTVAPTTGVFAGAPCELDLIVEQTQSFVAGVTPTALRCAADWASWAGQPDDVAAMDGYFAVAQWTGASWELRNLGTAGICGDGGVPEPLWPALDCVD